MIGIALLAALVALFGWVSVRANRQLTGSDFANASYGIEEQRLFACAPSELRAAATEALTTLRKTRVVATEPDRVLLDVRPAVTKLDDICGLGVEMRVAGAPPDQGQPGRSALHLRAFKKSLGSGHPALLAFSMQLRTTLRARGIHEWDPHR